MGGTVSPADSADSFEIREASRVPAAGERPVAASRGLSWLPLFLAAFSFCYVEFWAAGWGPATHVVTGRITLGLLTVLVAIWSLDRRWSAGGAAWYRTSLDRLLLPALAAGGASALVNANRWEEGALAWWFFGCAALLFLIVQDLLANRRIRLAELSDGFLIGTVPPVLYGIHHALTTGQRAYGLLEHPNHYAAVTAIVIPLAISRVVQRGPLGRWFYALCIGLAGAGLFLSGSRGALVSLFGALLVFAPRRLLIAVAAVGVPAVAVSLLARWESVVSRLPIYEYALDRIRERPWLGHGVFTFRYSQFGGVHFEAHNFALHIAYELGLVGLAVFLAAAVTIGLRARDATASDQQPWVAVLAGTALHQLVDFTWMFPGMFAMLPVMIAAVLWRPAPVRRTHQALAGVFAAALVLVVLAIGFYGGAIPLAFFGETALQND